MRAVLLRSLLVIGAGGLVLAGVLYVASTVDGRPPTVLEIGLTQPVADDAERGHITTSIQISFSEPIDPDSAVDAVQLDPPVDGTASSSGSSLIFTPAAPLELATEYTVRLAAGVRDLAGNEMSELPDPFVFQTTDRPTLASSEPLDGASDVGVDGPVVLVFSALMDTASVEDALSIDPAIDHDLRWSGDRLEIVLGEPLEPATEYAIAIGPEATDVTGVALGEEARISFRTVAPGLGVVRSIPADGVGGISTRTPIAVVLDRAIAPESVASDLWTTEPELTGTLELVPDGEDGDDGSDPDAGRVLRFTPSAPLPANTTVTVTLEPGLVAVDGGRLAEAVSWTFTTGAPQATLSNQVLFLSDRGGVVNVWAMNTDGTGQHQISAELDPVLDYAVAPDGSSLVVGDGRRLVFIRPDGSERRVLTDAAHLEFDPSFAPDGNRIVFARADAETGAGLGIWTWEIGAGSAAELALPSPSPVGFTPSPAPTASGDGAPALRAPRFSPDGNAMAFVDLRGAVGILELPGQRLTLIGAVAAGPPTWHADSGALLLLLHSGLPGPLEVTAPVSPLAPDEPVPTGIIRRSGTSVGDAGLDADARAVVTAPDGRVGWIDGGGTPRIADGLLDPGDELVGTGSLEVAELVLGPGRTVVFVATSRGDVLRIDLASGQRTRLADDGHGVRWLP